MYICLSIVLFSHWHAHPYYRLRRTRFLGTQLTSRASCGASAAASSSSGSCCPCACGSTGGWAGSGPSSSRASASCGRSCATAAGGTRVRRGREARRSLGTRVCSVRRGVGRSADPRGAQRDATGGAFRRRSVCRSAAPLGRGARKSQGFCAMTQQFVCLAVTPELHARGPRAAPQPLQKHELRPARARRGRRFGANQLVAP